MGRREKKLEGWMPGPVMNKNARESTTSWPGRDTMRKEGMAGKGMAGLQKRQKWEMGMVIVPTL